MATLDNHSLKNIKFKNLSAMLYLFWVRNQSIHPVNQLSSKYGETDTTLAAAGITLCSIYNSGWNGYVPQKSSQN